MIPTDVPAAAPFAPEKINQWFTEIISALQADHFLFETNTVSEDTKKMYAPLLRGDIHEMYSQTRNMSSVYFIKKTLDEYLQELRSRNIKVSKLAFDLSRSKILVWAQVADDDENTINQLILAEAKTNSNCYSNDFNIATTVVEESDYIEIPPHYRAVNIFTH